MPHHPLLASATLLVAAVTVRCCPAWSGRWPRCSAGKPARSSTNRRWPPGLRVALSSVVCLGWGLGLLLIFPALAYPLAPTLLIAPDLGSLIVVSSVIALIWGVARPPLTYITLRRRDG